jgi:hypothetical protein
MLGMFDLLPLMKGWDYKVKVYTREVTRGQIVEVDRVEESGWLMLLFFATDDAYGGVEIMFQGAGLNMFSTGVVNAQQQYDGGAVVQDPAGWVSRYYRPNPQSTTGAYFVCITTQGSQGSTMPHVPTSIIKMALDIKSTQEKATISLTTVRVIITDKKQFIRSLRAVMGMPTIQDIDPAILVAGTQEITQKGEFDKEKEKK